MKKPMGFWILLLSLTLMSACSSNGGSSANNSGGNSGGGTTLDPTAGYVVLAANDLGMHNIDREFSVFAISPPFNSVNAQVIGFTTSGTPALLDSSDAMVHYNAIPDATGSINSYSVGKTDFWTYANNLFQTSLSDGEGLTGRYMPQDAPTAGAQPLDYSTTYGWFTADGIPETPTDDYQATNSFPLMTISATSASGSSVLGYLDVVVPVAAEAGCRNCHVTGGVGASRSGIIWSNDPDLEVQSKENILRLHDALQSTTLAGSTPVLCARCHYSRALDLSGSGPSGSQLSAPTLSEAIHNFHGKLNSGGSLLFPDSINSCYNCHPGKSTPYLRGAMATGGMDCIDCHGGMLALGAEFVLKPGGSIDGTNDGKARRPWLDLPRCQSCHTGDAVDYLSITGGLAVQDSAYPFRLTQAYRTGDNSASALLATNKRFAENSNTLYRFSKGHGGIFCEGCHGSPHAVWPNSTTDANDNVAATHLQGYPGKIIECSVCHPQGSLELTTDGPHGLHNIDDADWVNGNHGTFYRKDPTYCKRCHGTDLLGTPLSRVTAARTFNVTGAANLAKDELVRCNRCHALPSS
jgi:hypothetical protein